MKKANNSLVEIGAKENALGWQTSLVTRIPVLSKGGDLIALSTSQPNDSPFVA